MIASCTTDCTTDADSDGTYDCADTCLDADGDGYGDPGDTTLACDQPAGYAAGGSDGEGTLVSSFTTFAVWVITSRSRELTRAFTLT